MNGDGKEGRDKLRNEENSKWVKSKTRISKDGTKGDCVSERDSVRADNRHSRASLEAETNQIWRVDRILRTRLQFRKEKT
jgi:hypothetical protein